MLPPASATTKKVIDENKSPKGPGSTLTPLTSDPGSTLPTNIHPQVHKNTITIAAYLQYAFVLNREPWGKWFPSWRAFHRCCLPRTSKKCATWAAEPLEKSCVLASQNPIFAGVKGQHLGWFGSNYCKWSVNGLNFLNRLFRQVWDLNMQFALAPGSWDRHPLVFCAPYGASVNFWHRCGEEEHSH